jgi:2-polyprenyl-3-methyl-5-hydroxy-6-metoxy-1,4-benzoquinol methylase
MLNWDPATHYQDIAVAERYDRERFSSIAGRVFSALEKSCLRRALADISRNASVVDVPCGTGRLAEVLLQEGFQVTGVDISAAMLDVAVRKLNRFGKRFQVHVADVAQFAEDQPKRYDVALCARVLMHFSLDDQISFLRNAARLARTRVVFTQSFSTPYQRFRRRVKRLLGHPAPAAYPITDAQLATLLADSGLREIRRLRPLALVSEAIYVIAEPI